LVRVALSNAERLMALINNLLDLERIESSSLSLQLTEAEPRPIAMHAIEVSRASAEARNITIRPEIHTSAKIYADQDRLAQVLVNLLSNAIKFSRDNDTVLVSVTDT